jgi:hypothetical protein
MAVGMAAFCILVTVRCFVELPQESALKELVTKVVLRVGNRSVVVKKVNFWQDIFDQNGARTVDGCIPEAASCTAGRYMQAVVMGGV